MSLLFLVPLPLTFVILKERKLEFGLTGSCGETGRSWGWENIMKIKCGLWTGNVNITDYMDL